MSQQHIVLISLSAGLFMTIIVKFVAHWVDKSSNTARMPILPGAYSRFLGRTLKQAGQVAKIGPIVFRRNADVVLAQITVGMTGALLVLIIDGAHLIPAWGAPLIFVGGAYVPIAMLKRQGGFRQKSIDTELPGVMEIVALALQAGLSFDGAVDYIVNHTLGVVGAELRKARAAIATGTKREAAYTSIAAAASPEMKLFIQTVLQAEKQGKPVADTILTLADSVRSRHQLQVELRANRLPTTMLLPIFIFIVPPVLLIYLLPAIVNLKYMSI